MAHKIHYRVEDSVAILRMDDGKANSIESVFIRELHEGLDRAEAEARAVVVEGREGFFSAGLDLKVLPTMAPDDLRDFIGIYGRAMTRLWLHPAPVVAAVTGHMVAGGAVLAMCCDRRVGAEGSYRVGMNEVAIGIPLPAFVWEIAAPAISPMARNEALLFGEVYDPARALSIGYLDRLVPGDRVRAAALAEAARLATLSSYAVGQTKRLVRGPLAERARAHEAEMIDSFFKGGPFAQP